MRLSYVSEEVNEKATHCSLPGIIAVSDVEMPGRYCKAERQINTAAKEKTCVLAEGNERGLEMVGGRQPDRQPSKARWIY